MRGQLCQKCDAVWEVNCVKSDMQYERSTVSKVWSSMRGQMCQNVIQYEMSKVSILHSMRVQLCQKCDAVWEVKWAKRVMQYVRTTVSKDRCSMKSQMSQFDIVWEVKCVKMWYSMIGRSTVSKVWYSMRCQMCQFYTVWEFNCVKSVMSKKRDAVWEVKSVKTVMRYEMLN